MKLKTSFFNATAFRKNVTRFAPAWGLYTLCLVMGLLLMTESGVEYWLVANLADTLQIMAVVNLGYALLCAMLLFGDLYNSRMCNALHALPMRRECWFVTNLTSGLLFSLVPSLIMTLLAIPLSMMSVVTRDYLIPLLWLVGNNLQFITFFGIAVISAMCVGSRFAMTVVYGILNFGSLVAYWMVDTLYTPVLYGVVTDAQPFMKLCPGVWMASESYFHMERIYEENLLNRTLVGGTFTLTERWGSLWIWAGVGLVLMGLALLLYRRRQLETAGDFIAVKPLKPVFLGIYTLCAGVGFQFCQDLFLGDTIMGLVWLCVGLAVGYFTGLMLLGRTTRVFRKKAFITCAGIILAMAATLLIPVLDLFGIEGWIPEAEQVASVTVHSGHYVPSRVYYDTDAVMLESDEEIETALHLHELALAQKGYFDDWSMGGGFYVTDTSYGWGNHPAVSFTIAYTMKDGRTVHRYYYGYVDSEIGQILRPWYSDIQTVLGITKAQIPEFARNISEVYVDGHDVTTLLSAEQRIGLLDAIAADCAEGNMAQDWDFHPQNVDTYGMGSCSLEFNFLGGDPRYNWCHIQVFSDSRHTMQWLEDNGMQEYMGMYTIDVK